MSFGLHDVELSSATQIRLTKQLFWEWRPPMENSVYRNILCWTKRVFNFVVLTFDFTGF